MHICLAGVKSCPPEIGGVEVFAFEIGRRLVSSGTKVTVIVPRKKNQRKMEDVEGISVRRVWAVNNRHLLKVSMMPEELRVAAEIRPDVFHANDPPSGVVSLLSSRWKSSILTVHGRVVPPSEWSTPFRLGGKFLHGLAVKGATAVATTDRKTASLLGEYRKDVVVIPPGVDTQLFRKGAYSRPDSLEEGKINILFVGRLTKGKGVDILIESLGHIRPDILARIELTVIGDGPLAKTVRESKPSAGSVNWIGEVPHRDIPPFFANADLLVMPSRSEGLPISMLEAMSAGLPVVSTTVGGIETYFNDEHLTRIESITSEGVANAIERAIESRGLIDKKAKTARELVESQFSWDRVAERYLRLYEETTA